MVAGINTAIMFDCNAFAAELVIDTKLRRKSHVLGHKRLEVVDQHFAKILLYAIQSNTLDEEISVLIGIDRPVGNDGVGMIGPRFWAANDRQLGFIPFLRGRRLEGP